MNDPVTPRILDEAAARAYLGGKLNPRSVMPPVRIGSRVVWDRVALDQKLDSLFGVKADAEAKGETALERCRRAKKNGNQNAA
jgi:hypothetical protein